MLRVSWTTSGLNSSSESIKKYQSKLAACIFLFLTLALSFSQRKLGSSESYCLIIFAPYSRAISRVSSVLLPSQTMISAKSVREFKARRKVLPEFKVKIQTDAGIFLSEGIQN